MSIEFFPGVPPAATTDEIVENQMKVFDEGIIPFIKGRHNSVCTAEVAARFSIETREAKKRLRLLEKDGTITGCLKSFTEDCFGNGGRALFWSVPGYNPPPTTPTTPDDPTFPGSMAMRA